MQWWERKTINTPNQKEEERGTFYKLWFTAILKFQWEDIRRFPTLGAWNVPWLCSDWIPQGGAPLFIVFQVTSYSLWVDAFSNIFLGHILSGHWGICTCFLKSFSAYIRWRTQISLKSGRGKEQPPQILSEILISVLLVGSLG